ncbi:hypothetical protein [Helicobacter macacae]|uniref:Autotransporter domain-containing protein n=1 Tax=Helicobacter macacae MIT 99-5501 TaxID=1357400 RepID=V8C6G9_9HELI|nr:hypothetical protein [Helicobacter macacae]ETD22939.1 hypothetical protein HMPREF2086_01740 [Helicobacter macacae MIT 99-5501]
MKKANFNAINAINERERESSSRLSGISISSPSLASGLNPISSPSLAEGARGWVDTTSASQVKSAVASNANFASISKADSVLSAKSLKDTHPQTPSAREGALRVANTLTLKKVDSREGAFALPTHEVAKSTVTLREGAFKIANSTSQQTTPSKPKRLALSLATASILASGALDIAAAACRWSEDWSRGDANSHGVGRYERVDCTGVSNVVQNAFRGSNYYRETRYYLSGSTNDRAINYTFQKQGGTAYHNNYIQEVYFNNFSAPNTSVSLTNGGNNNGNISMGFSAKATSFGSLSLSGNWNRGVSITNSTLGSFTNQGIINRLNVNNEYGASNIGSFSNSGTITLMYVNGGSRIGSFNNTGTINTINVGDRNVSNSGFLNDFSSGTINTVNIYNTSITIQGSASTWNGGTSSGEHILGGANTTINIADNSIQIQAGDDIQVNAVYLFNSLVKKNGAGQSGISYRHLADTAGLSLKPAKGGLMISADIATSYGASAYRALVLSILRRNAMTQNILDTMTTKTFHSDRYYNQEVELRLLQYDLSRLTNRSSKFSKQTRKNQSKVDKVREKMAKLTLEQSKGQNLDKGYNNFEVIDQLDAIFIPYTGRRDWRFFALPYASHSYVDLGASSAMEYAGGAVFGVQRNLRSAGIFGGYLGYEFVNTDTELVGNVATRIQTHSLQAGLNYFQTFAITSKLWEGFIRANIRGGVDMPQFNMQASSYNLKLESNSDKVPLMLMYNVGAEVKGGLTFYQFKRNSYVSPEVSLSYDMISAPKSWIEKPLDTVGGASYRPLGAHEYYNAVYWHLPQLGAAVRYYKMWGNTFRTNLKAGIKYNMLNKQKAYIQIGNLKDTSEITLPAVYGNLAFDFIWMIKKNHELSFGYDGLFYASTFAKERNIRGQMAKTADWFNGVTTTLNFKYAYWFGGSDYVTDKDGNAVSRSIAEGKKSKKGKKSKSKKSKKSKKKVYYIDG